MTEDRFYSIITICYNAAGEIQKTFDSLRSQSCRDYQHIIIDGASKDCTLAIVDKNKSPHTVVISEPDDGIYDAMNKGIKAASGQWVIFMNAGDEFYDSEVLAKVKEIALRSTSDVLIGGVWIKYETGFERGIPPLPLSGMWKNITGCHQSTFYKTKSLQKYQYSLAHRIAADYHLNYRMFTDGLAFENMDMNYD